MLIHHAFQCLAIEHGEHLKGVGHLHGRRTGVGVARDDVLPQTLCGNHKLFAQLSRAQKQYLFHVEDFYVFVLAAKLRQTVYMAKVLPSFSRSGGRRGHSVAGFR